MKHCHRAGMRAWGPESAGSAAGRPSRPIRNGLCVQCVSPGRASVPSAGGGATPCLSADRRRVGGCQGVSNWTHAAFRKRCPPPDFTLAPRGPPRAALGPGRPRPEALPPVPSPGPSHGRQPDSSRGRRMTASGSTPRPAARRCPARGRRRVCFPGGRIGRPAAPSRRPLHREQICPESGHELIKICTNHPATGPRGQSNFGDRPTTIISRKPFGHFDLAPRPGSTAGASALFLHPGEDPLRRPRDGRRRAE
jgi:hypothetical protein